MKAAIIIPSLLLQKTCKNSKTKDHNKALKRRLQLWTDGHLAELLKEGETIQSSLKQVNAPKTQRRACEKVCNAKGNVSVIKLITNNMQNGILPLTDTTLKLLKQKHPKSAPFIEEVLLPD